MNYGKLLSMIAAVAIPAGGLVLMAPPASARAPIVVSAPVPADIVTRHIGYADLNLASSAGEMALKGRVRGAIASLCGEAIGGNDGRLTTRLNDRYCRSAAWTQATPQIDRAVERAHEIASTGTSTIAAAGIAIVLPK